MNNLPTESIGILASDDLFFSTRICDTAREINCVVKACSRCDQILELLAEQNVPLLLIDLASMSESLDEIARFRKASPELSIIAFGSHVETKLLQQAKQAGCDKVYPRSRFTKILLELLQEHLLNNSTNEK